jgi:ankyrin repeat protein
MRAWLFAAVAAVTLAGAGGAWAASGLIDAAQKNDHAEAMKLVTSASAKETSEDGGTALMWAAFNGDAELAQALVKAGADVKAANLYGATPMREAATSGSTAVLKVLLDAGADADSTTAEGQTSLMVVARTANVEAAKLLLDHGAKVNAAETTEDQTALMWAADQGQEAMVRLLVAHGADVNRHSRVHENDIRVSAEPRVKYEPSGGQTALIYAARQGCVGCAKALVEGGAKINDVDPDGLTPLLFAVLNAHFDVARYLVEAGADVNRWDFWGRTPLWAAVDYNTLPRGGRSDRPSLDQTSPLELARLLLAKGANPNARLKLQAPLRAVGPDRGADSIMGVGMTPLLRAARGGDVEAVDLLLKSGALVDLPLEREWRDQIGGMTPLMIASGLGAQVNDTRGKLITQAEALKTVQRILEAHPDINARDDRGNSAIMGAVFRGWNDVIKVLIEAGADPYLPNKAGKSAFDVAQAKTATGAGPARQEVTIDPASAALIQKLKPIKTAAR